MTSSTIPTWRPGPWQVGEKVRWRGVTLVCCVGHVTNLHAVHPWGVDQSESQQPSEAALYWTPDGITECDKLRHLLVDNRQSWGDYQRACIWFAAGGVAKKAA